MSIYLGDKKITPAILYDARQTSLEATINENGEHTYLAPQGQLYNQVIVTVNDEKCTDFAKVFTTNDLNAEGALLVKRGKKAFHLFKPE